MTIFIDADGCPVVDIHALSSYSVIFADITTVDLVLREFFTESVSPGAFLRKRFTGKTESPRIAPEKCLLSKWIASKHLSRKPLK
jgi:hypothetical protein